MIKNNEPLSMAEATEYIDKASGAEVLAFVKKFLDLKANDGKEIRKKIKSFDSIKIDEKNISKIIDIMPENEEELNKIFVGTSLDDDEAKKILDVIKEFK
ncbi:hypothetical protein HY212_07160 [Candidatus Pacearchaeota archaeon]|nr:hypothetical protein [Candidatus Pacearchaeota archaeon]